MQQNWYKNKLCHSSLEKKKYCWPSAHLQLHIASESIFDYTIMKNELGIDRTRNTFQYKLIKKNFPMKNRERKTISHQIFTFKSKFSNIESSKRVSFGVFGSFFISNWSHDNVYIWNVMLWFDIVIDSSLFSSFQNRSPIASYKRWR